MFVVCETRRRSAVYEHQRDRAPDRDQRDQLGPGVRRSPRRNSRDNPRREHVGRLRCQHYWVTSSGDTINFKVAHLTPTAANDIVAVRWGDYTSVITGGTGKFANATGSLDYFGVADFTNLTLVLRYRGQVCYSK